MKIFLILLLMIPAGGINSTESPPLEIEYAYLRKQHPQYDMGTIHLYLKNISNEVQYINRVWINDEEISDEVNEFTVWRLFLPNPVYPGKVADVMVKLSKPLTRLIKIEVEDGKGNKYSRVIQPFPPDLRITYIAFGNEYKTLYIWIKNSGKETIKIKSIFLDKKVISLKSRIKSVKPDSKQCYKILLKEPLKQGEYISIRIDGEEEVIAESLIRVYSYFPVTSWDGDTREEYGFDSRPLIMGPAKDEKELEKCKNTPWFKIYHIFNDPACEDGKKNLPLGSQAKKIITETEKYKKSDPIHLTTLYLCEYKKPWNYFIYGELADVIMVNPYEVAYYGNPPENDGDFVKLAKLASEPRLLYAIVEAFKDNNKSRKIHRFPTYEEEIKIVDSEIKNGAKGLIYFMGNFEKDCGYNNSQELLNAIKHINKKIQNNKNNILIEYS